MMPQAERTLSDPVICKGYHNTYASTGSSSLNAKGSQSGDRVKTGDSEDFTISDLRMNLLAFTCILDGILYFFFILLSMLRLRVVLDETALTKLFSLGE